MSFVRALRRAVVPRAYPHLAFGRLVSADFRARVYEIADDLGVCPDWIMAAMAFETGESFSPSRRNAAGSGAVGLIQFMPQTAAAMGTTTAALAQMSAVEQLAFVERYFRPWRGRLDNIGDLYMAILWPAGIGHADSYVLFDKSDPRHPARYAQNVGLDFNRDGLVTRGEAVTRVKAKLARGLGAELSWTEL